ncbi:MAG: hypothetical protein HKM93_10445 [Desulfobacteraceae bacterium]|nr:hypothetical protein [Desulfobacteraceae bacterium]
MIERCEKCGVEGELFYDDDGCLLCADCHFEDQCIDSGWGPESYYE